MFGKSLATFWAPLAIICCAIGATLFFIVQKFEIHAFCWMCVGIDTAALIMVIPAILLFLNKTEETNAEDDTKDKLGFWTGCISDLKASCTQKISFLHPVLWLTVYFLCAAGPIYFGTQPDPEPEKPAEPELPEVEIDHFGALDLRVAKILECEPVPKAKKLLKKILR